MTLPFDEYSKETFAEKSSIKENSKVLRLFRYLFSDFAVL